MAGKRRSGNVPAIKSNKCALPPHLADLGLRPSKVKSGTFTNFNPSSKWLTVRLVLAAGSCICSSFGALETSDQRSLLTNQM